MISARFSLWQSSTWLVSFDSTLSCRYHAIQDVQATSWDQGTFQCMRRPLVALHKPRVLSPMGRLGLEHYVGRRRLVPADLHQVLSRSGRGR